MFAIEHGFCGLGQVSSPGTMAKKNSFLRHCMLMLCILWSQCQRGRCNAQASSSATCDLRALAAVQDIPTVHMHECYLHAAHIGCLTTTTYPPSFFLAFPIPSRDSIAVSDFKAAVKINATPFRISMCGRFLDTATGNQVCLPAGCAACLCAFRRLRSGCVLIGACRRPDMCTVGSACT